MESGNRASVSVRWTPTLFAPETISPGALVTLGDDSSHHARVVRLDVGDAVRLTNGAGTLATGIIERMGRENVGVRVEHSWRVAAPPRLVMLVPVADRDRMLWLAEKLTELAVSVWQPVIFRRSRSVSPRGEGDAFASRARARMVSALEQSGGAWLPELRTELPMLDAISGRGGPLPSELFLLDVTGAPLLGGSPKGDAAVIFGPEGGVEDDERALLLERGWLPVSLGAGTLRFETAGIAAAAIVRAAQAHAALEGTPGREE